MPFKQPRVHLLDAALVLQDIAARAGVLLEVHFRDPPKRIAILDDVDLLDKDAVLAVVPRLARRTREQNR